MLIIYLKQLCFMVQLKFGIRVLFENQKHILNNNSWD